MKDVTFLLPAFNEEKSIGKLIKTIKNLYPSSHIIVIDNNSTDKTVQIAESIGAEIIPEEKQGKAHAIRKGFEHANSPFVIMMDADNTYDPHDAKRLLECLKSNKADLVLGSRLKGQKEKGSISKLNIVGNHIISYTASKFYSPVSDVCTGYWAFRKEVTDYLLDIGITSSGFEVEAEMYAKVSKGNFTVLEQPIYYRIRSDEAKLNSFKDGFKIFKTLFKHRFINCTLLLIPLIIPNVYI